MQCPWEIGSVLEERMGKREGGHMIVFAFGCRKPLVNIGCAILSSVAHECVDMSYSRSSFLVLQNAYRTAHCHPKYIWDSNHTHSLINIQSWQC